MDRDAEASEKFNCTERERALFEAGIKLGTIYHQFVGTPFDGNSLADLEKMISRTIEVQPYVESAEVSIERCRLPTRKDTYSYSSLTGDMIDAVVVVKVGDTRVTAEMRYDDKLDYPLMYVSSVE